jgi:hypothetical protein
VWTPSNQPPLRAFQQWHLLCSPESRSPLQLIHGSIQPKPPFAGPAPPVSHNPSISVWPASRSAACALPSHGLRCFDSEDQKTCHHQRR